MHKTFLNKEEIKVIKNADQIIDKIGGFPSMENGKLIEFSARFNKDETTDIELIFDLTGWLRTLDFYLTHLSDDVPEKQYYKHNVFEERTIKMIFKNCNSYSFSNRFDNPIGEIKFGGQKQLKEKNRLQDLFPEIERVLKGPYCCFYSRAGGGFDLFISFNANKSEISAEIY